MSIAIRVKRPPPPRRRPVGAVAPVLKAAAMVATDRRFIFKPEVLERVGGVAYPTLWRWMRDGKFPAAVEVGGRIAWLESDIDAWMLSRPRREYKSRQLA
jgi:prophage regulatory protein